MPDMVNFGVYIWPKSMLIVTPGKKCYIIKSVCYVFFIVLFQHIQYKTVSLLFITAMVSIGAEKSSSSSSPGSSGEVNGVTITSCRSGERHSSSSEDKESNGQCISAYVMKESGNITLSGTNIGRFLFTHSRS